MTPDYLIVYASKHHGNTKRIAAGMADEIGAVLQTPAETTTGDIINADIVGFGSGIYFWRHHRDLLQLADELPGMPAKRAFLFSTSGIGPGWLWHRALRHRLRRKGFTIVDEYACRGHDSYGLLKLIGGIHKNRPNQRDISQAKRFAAQLVDAVPQNKD